MWCSVVTYLWQMQQHFDLLRNILNLLNNYKATFLFRWGIKEKFMTYIHSSYLCVGHYIISAAGFSLWVICNLSIYYIVSLKDTTTNNVSGKCSVEVESTCWITQSTLWYFLLSFSFAFLHFIFLMKIRQCVEEHCVLGVVFWRLTEISFCFGAKSCFFLERGDTLTRWYIDKFNYMCCYIRWRITKFGTSSTTQPPHLCYSTFFFNLFFYFIFFNCMLHYSTCFPWRTPKWMGDNITCACERGI